MHRELCGRGVGTCRPGDQLRVRAAPQLTPTTDLGAVAVAAYAERQGVDVDEFTRAMGPALTAEQVGRSVLEIATGQGIHRSNTLTSAGLSPLA
jgi:hypothetical protein